MRATSNDNALAIGIGAGLLAACGAFPELVEGHAWILS